jgi:hypothetical protein
MSAVQAEPPSSDALAVRLDEMLAELADAVLIAARSRMRIGLIGLPGWRT